MTGEANNQEENVIDFESKKNLNLNLGKDFEKVKSYKKDAPEKAEYDPKPIKLEPKKNPFYLKFISGKDLLKQPSPLKWRVKGWIPENSIGMIHGASGVGKTFFVLDLIMPIANGHETWNNQKIKSGYVLYMAGEGHHGISSRIKLYMQQKGLSHNDLNIGVSDKSIPLNNLEALQSFKEQLRELEQIPSVIVFDTLHRFLEGDENSSKDAGDFIRACEEIKNEFGCTIILVHHTGLSADAQTRARGSSAWRGAMDFEIGVQKGKSEDTIYVTQYKMKDSEIKKPLAFKMKKDIVLGWQDEDSEPVTSLYLELIETQETHNQKNTIKIIEKKDLFYKIFLHSGKPISKFDDGEETPVISKEQVKTYFREVEGKSPEEIRVIINPKQKSRLISSLVDAKLISIQEDKEGKETFYIVNCDYWKAELMQSLETEF